MKKYLIILFSLITAPVFSQTYQLKVEITEEVKAELLQKVKELFPVTATFSYNVSNYDAYSSFEKLSDKESYNDEYLKKQEELLRNDSRNPIYMNNLANYYKFHTKYMLAESYYRQALGHMDIRYFDNDSASFYSFRGIIKVNLDDQNAIFDMDHALRVNPNDSIAISFYPMLLINQQEYAKARNICVKALDNNPAYPAFPYVFLAFSEAMEGFAGKISKAETDEKLARSYRKMDYHKLVDFTLIDKYTKKFPNDTLVQNLRPIMDVFLLMLKLSIFEKTDDHRIILAYTPHDIEKIKALEAWFKQASEKKLLNSYSVNRNLGYLCFMRNELDNAIQYFEKAIAALPASANKVTSTEAYDAIIGICFLRKDYAAMEKYILQKIAAKPEGKESDSDHRAMAIIYYNKDSLETCEKWLEKSRELNPSNFTTVQLMSHLYYLKGFTLLSQSYGEEALKYMQSNSDAEAIAIQFGVYFLIDGNPASAYNNIRTVQDAMGEEVCESCKELIDKYIMVK